EDFVLAPVETLYRRAGEEGNSKSVLPDRSALPLKRGHSASSTWASEARQPAIKKNMLIILLIFN
ncbi:MAG: hypothetical protein R6W81_14595, partial [Bacteroidales bacterium]